MGSNRIRGIRQTIPAGTVLARTGTGKGPPAAIRIGAMLGGAGASGAAFVRANQTKDTNVVGTTTNDDATAGNIGEYISSTVLVGAAVAVADSTNVDVTSISLTAGDWDVWGTIANVIPGTGTAEAGWVSTSSATFPTAPNGGAEFSQQAAINNFLSMHPVGVKRLSLAVTTTVYLTTRIVYSSGSSTAFGIIAARRVR